MRGQSARLFGLLLALANSCGQLIYQVVALIRGSGGDEYLIAYYLGIPKAAVSGPLAAAFALGLVWAFRRLEGWRQRLKYGAALFAGSILQGPLLMLGNQAVQNQIDAGNPFFRPVCGFSLPVLLAMLFAALALLAALRVQRASDTVPLQGLGRASFEDIKAAMAKREKKRLWKRN